MVKLRQMEQFIAVAVFLPPQHYTFATVPHQIWIPHKSHRYSTGGKQWTKL
jgi:hypothetical protein